MKATFERSLGVVLSGFCGELTLAFGLRLQSGVAVGGCHLAGREWLLPWGRRMRRELNLGGGVEFRWGGAGQPLAREEEMENLGNGRCQRNREDLRCRRVSGPAVAFKVPVNAAGVRH